MYIWDLCVFASYCNVIAILSTVVCVLECAEQDTRASLEYLVSDEVSGTTCPPEHLVRTSEKTMELFAELTRASEEYSADTSSKSHDCAVACQVMF